MAIKEQEFVGAATSLGLSKLRILFRHIVPNTLGPAIVYATLTIPSFILFEASLSYLGVGIEAPNSSWGILIKEGAGFLETQLLLIFPRLQNQSQCRTCDQSLLQSLSHFLLLVQVCWSHHHHLLLRHSTHPLVDSATTNIK